MRRIRGVCAPSVVLILACVQFVVVLDETAIALLAPLVARDFQLGSEVRHLMVTPFAAAFIVALPATAVALRSVDARRFVAPAAATFAFTALAGALAVSPQWLVLARAAQGATAAVTATCVLASLHAIAGSGRARIRDFAVFTVISGSGAVASLIIAAPLAAVSWRWSFVAVSVGAAACAAIWPAALRSSPAPRVATSGPPDPFRSTMPPWTALAAVAAANALLAASVITTSFVLQDDHGWSVTETGAGFLPLNAAAAVGAALASRVVPRLGPGRALLMGLAVLAVGCVAVSAAPGVSGALIAATVPVGMGVGLTFPLVNDRTLATAGEFPVRRAAELGAAQQTGLATGALVAAMDSDGASYLLSGCVIGIACLAATLGPGSRDRSRGRQRS
ncbi:MFS transporter [Gordonia neofelifaecis]|uniref:Major facilitator superfamily (MFS) profile domain-containing protein n=1 Tax=Gordonia neofelifaecis NRRL B-59395 TaxID=644548 RepID=F1YGV6_9ACTN|nr:MFS transporter [Gordonia neofelifaecis]EGD56254.1 hypothetical protein SCNU_05351 [Gordonia neofelifaecis NRRL B-59395]